MKKEKKPSKDRYLYRGHGAPDWYYTPAKIVYTRDDTDGTYALMQLEGGQIYGRLSDWMPWPEVKKPGKDAALVKTLLGGRLKLNQQRTRDDKEKLAAMERLESIGVSLRHAVSILQEARGIIEDDAHRYLTSSFVYHDIGNAIFSLDKGKKN